ncbi:MAG: GDP-mannose 4,6-dehydratase [Verrucomicrobiales bacterium]|nr:NAD-dependent epimerase/dehydratase family protein [Verrucomicrobiaceae bacterium]
MKILITGGCGFIGSHAASYFRDQGHQVVVLDNLSRCGTEGNLEWLRQTGEIEHSPADIRNWDQIDKALSQHTDTEAVLHLAAQVAVTTSVTDPVNDFEINATGTFNMLEGARKHLPNLKMFVYSSTNKVYGGLEDGELELKNDRWGLSNRPNGISETEQLDFHSPYGCSKGAADQYVRDYSRIYDIPTVVLRQSCIYGTRQFGVEDQGWVAWMTIAAMTHQQITVYGDGKQIRDLLWVEDLVKLYELCVENPDKANGQAFNTGGGPTNTLSLLELLNFLAEREGRDLGLKFDEERPGDQKVFVSNNTKLKEILGWKPTTSVDQGLEQLAQWISNNREVIVSFKKKAA